MRIFKYPLSVVDTQQVQLPLGAEVLCLQLQHGKPCLWALVPDAVNKWFHLTVHIHGTGSPIVGYPGKYLGTFQLDGGALVFHAFMELP